MFRALDKRYINEYIFYLFNFNLHLTGLQNISKAKARGLNVKELY